MVIVNITLNDLRVAYLVGAERHYRSLVSKRKSSFPFKYAGQGWATHIIGACSELAVARFLNKHWGGGIDTFNASDLDGINCEIRSSESLPRIRLNDSNPVIGVQYFADEPLKFAILGWVFPAEVRAHDEWQKYEPPNWYPPLNAWRSIHTFLEMSNPCSF